MARVEGWWVAGGEDEGGGLVGGMAFMPFGGVEEDMLVVEYGWRVFT